MKNVITVLFLTIFATGCDLDFATSNAEENTDMCPALSKEIEAQRPNYYDFVTVKPREDQSLWMSQYEIYMEAEKEFKAQFADEIAQVDSEWNKLRARQSVSKTRFYKLYPAEEYEELYAEVVSVCWTNVMGIDESEKDNLCKTLDKAPNDSDWGVIYACTTERSEALGIKFN